MEIVLPILAVGACCVMFPCSINTVKHYVIDARTAADIDRSPTFIES